MAICVIAGGDDQGLAQRMSVPSCSGAGLEGNEGAADAGGGGGLEGHVDPDGVSRRRWATRGRKRPAFAPSASTTWIEP